MTAAAVGAGVIAGNGAVYAFDHFPAVWLKDRNGELPAEDRQGVQRVKSHPWKYVFTASFIVIGVYMGIADPRYAVAAFIACWILLETGMADKKYGAIPDQTVLLLAITGFGFIPFHDGMYDMLLGAAAGGCTMLIIKAAVKLFSGKAGIGYGEVKLCCAIGLVGGLWGAGIAIGAGAFACGIYAAAKLSGKNKNEKIRLPFGAFICGAAAVYIIVLHDFF